DVFAVNDGVDLRVHRPAERRRQPIDGREEVEPAAAVLVAEVRQGADPGIASDTNPQVVAEREMGPDQVELARESVEYAGAEGIDLAVGRVGHRIAPPPTTSGSSRQRCAMSSTRMRSCSNTMPSSNASGRGGQP